MVTDSNHKLRPGAPQAPAPSPVPPLPLDMLAVDIAGERDRVQAFFFKYSIEHGPIRRDGNEVFFRAFVPFELMTKLRAYVRTAAVAFNASERQRDQRDKTPVGKGNRFKHGETPAGVGVLRD